MESVDEYKYSSPYMVARLSIEKGVDVINRTKMNNDDKGYLLYTMGILRGLAEDLKKDVD